MSGNTANQKSENKIEVEGRSASCDGGGGALGHPKVYLEMGEATEVECPYCGRTFVHKS